MQPLGTNLNEISFRIQKLSLKEMRLKMSSAKLRQFIPASTCSLITDAHSVYCTSYGRQQLLDRAYLYTRFYILMLAFVQTLVYQHILSATLAFISNYWVVMTPPSLQWWFDMAGRVRQTERELIGRMIPWYYSVSIFTIEQNSSLRLGRVYVITTTDSSWCMCHH